VARRIMINMSLYLADRSFVVKDGNHERKNMSLYFIKSNICTGTLYHPSVHVRVLIVVEETNRNYYKLSLCSEAMVRV